MLYKARKDGDLYKESFGYFIMAINGSVLVTRVQPEQSKKV